ncbi:hypothetical protein [Actinosynnema sp. NPDC023587]
MAEGRRWQVLRRCGAAVRRLVENVRPAREVAGREERRRGVGGRP